MIYLVFLGGVFVGSIITQIIVHRKTAHGYFKLISVDDEEDLCKLHISIEPTILATKDRIILEKDNSQF